MRFCHRVYQNLRPHRVSCNVAVLSSLLAELPRGKKSTLFLYFKTMYSIYVPQQLFNRTQFFSHALDGKMSSILNLAMEHFVTNTHISCLEPAAVQSCKHIALKQFFLAIYNAMPASFSPTQKYRFPARTHPTIRLK